MDYNAMDNNAILGACAALLQGVPLRQDESRLLVGVTPMEGEALHGIVEAIRAGQDPLGEAFVQANSAAKRRVSGSVYTSPGLVASMVAWSKSQGIPERVVDCGCGSGRFALACARAFPDARIVAVDASPMATLMCRANAIAAGLSITVVLGDFIGATLPFDDAQSTLWIGNPPYVRHHDLSEEQKLWFANARADLGIGGSGLAGLHAHFVASIAKRFGGRDVGCLLLSAEWMDVAYGASIRDALTRRLGLRRIRTFDKTSEQFSGTLSTAVVVGFCLPRVDRVEVNGSDVDLRSLAASSRWSDVIADRQDCSPGDGLVRLGEIARVHRGTVTGRNGFWVRRPGDVSDELSVPVVCHARELAGDRPMIRDVDRLSRLVTLPDDLSTLPVELCAEAEAIIEEGLHTRVNEGYVASRRKHWWSVKPSRPPAIMMTYMARHAPTFVVNSDGLGMLNVVHGIYPTVELSDHAVRRLADYLNNNVSVADGRTYAGGLTKFEPREVERLVVPSPEVLEEGQ